MKYTLQMVTDGCLYLGKIAMIKDLQISKTTFVIRPIVFILQKQFIDLCRKKYYVYESLLTSVIGKSHIDKYDLA